MHTQFNRSDLLTRRRQAHEHAYGKHACAMHKSVPLEDLLLIVYTTSEISSALQ